MNTLYKITGPDGEAIHGGSGRWPLPKVDALGRRHRGAWRTIPHSEPLAACAVGFHLIDADNLHLWLAKNSVVWEAEYDGEVIDHGDKYVVRKARLVRRVAGVDVAPTRRWDSGGYGLRGAQLLEFIVRQEQQLAEANAAGRLVFGVHRIDAREAEDAPAWPSYGKLKRRSDAKWRRFIKGAA